MLLLVASSKIFWVMKLGLAPSIYPILAYEYLNAPLNSEKAHYRRDLV
jgi:hypothetical protein